MSKKKNISPIPRGYRTVTCCLTVIDVDAAVAFYRAAFGAEVLTRMVVSEGTPAWHATLKIGNSIIALNKEAPEKGIFAPLSLAATGSQIHLYVADVELSWQLALAAGALVHTALHDAFWGDRCGILQDGNGHLWSLASKIENLSQAEILARATVVVADENEVPAAEMLTDPIVAVKTVADAAVMR